MPYDRSVPGEDTVDRLFEREDLARVSIPGAGHAYTGPAASRALQALGAEAMTVDGSIIVSEDFDPRDPEHMALYAHEQYHVEHGTGEGGAHHIHDAEEVAARAVQRMVLHRMAGGYEGGYQPGGGGGAAAPGQGADQGGRGVSDYSRSGDDAPESKAGRPPDPAAGYAALRAQGMSHEEIVDRLAREVLSTMEAGENVGGERHQDKKGYL
ncbi:MAG: DUF4157 domain-containing protein [Alphaproteobacteria bacterium]|nr:DUF4157 domain-containing protein [Alphaproteobacteria bacterium]